MGDLLRLTHSTIHSITRTASIAIQDPAFKLLEFENMFPSQVGLLGIQMIWTRDAEHALQNARTDKKIMQNMNQKFLDLLNELIEVTTTELTKMDRTKFETLVTIHVHQKDIFDDLVCNMELGYINSVNDI